MRIGIAGVHGHGRGHVDEALRLSKSGTVSLCAVADPRGPGDVPEGVVAYEDAATMIRDADLDIVVLSTPIPTHAALADAAMRAGAHVLLEKPPVVDLEEHALLTATSRATGKAVQVGFQSLASDGVAALAQLIDDGTIGSLVHLCAVGLWDRSDQYWRRAGWAGHRRIDGIRVADGVTTNPLAHAVATALAAAGAADAADVRAVELDMYRAADIDTDDTSSGMVTLHSGRRVGFALATTSPHRDEPYVLARGSSGHAVYFYTRDLLQVYGEHSPLPRTRHFARVSLLQNLVDHVADGAPLLVPLARTGAFTRVLDEVVSSSPPRRIPSAYVDAVSRGGEQYRVVHDIARIVEMSAWEGRLFREVGAPWSAQPNVARTVVPLS